MKIKNSKIIAILGMLAIIAVQGCKSERNAPSRDMDSKPSLQVDGYVVKAEPFNSTLVVVANVLANEQVEVMAPVSGQVMSIKFSEGEYVRMGSPIVQIDDRIWKAQIRGLEAQLLALEKDIERKKKLLDIEGSTLAEIEQSVANADNLKAQIQELAIKIDLAKVSAPFSGTLGMRDFSLGAFLNIGDVITTLTETNQLKVDFLISEAYYNSVSIGQHISVLVKGDTLEAKIYAINPQVDISSRTMNIRASLLPNKDNKIMPGTFAQVIIPTNVFSDALLVPTQAIVPEIDKQTVYVVKNGKAKRKILELGDRTNNKVHILSGLEEGDTVITTGLLAIKEGMNIQISSLNE